VSAVTPPRGGKTGKSFAPRKTIYKDKKPPALWTQYLADLREFREANGVSTRDVAVAMGTTVTVVSNWERGFTTPHPWDFCVYLEAIGVTRIKPE
jgi:ribosome-binding protein aMBF1 (putative translation factor)